MPRHRETCTDDTCPRCYPRQPTAHAGAPITAVHRAIFAAILRRAETQEPRPGIKRNRCALDAICGASIALQAAGDTIGAQSMTNAAFLVSVRGAPFLRELIEGGT